MDTNNRERQGDKQQRPPRKMAVDHALLGRLSRLPECSTVLADLPAGAARLTVRLPTWFTRFGLIHREGTAFELFAVEPLDGRFGRLALRHLDKPEAFGAASVPVDNHIDLVHN